MTSCKERRIYNANGKKTLIYLEKFDLPTTTIADNGIVIARQEIKGVFDLNGYSAILTNAYIIEGAASSSDLKKKSLDIMLLSNDGFDPDEGDDFDTAASGIVGANPLATRLNFATGDYTITDKAAMIEKEVFRRVFNKHASELNTSLWLYVRNAHGANITYASSETLSIMLAFEQD